MLKIRVHPRAKSDRVEVGEGGKVRVQVMAAPEGGKANGAVVALLAKRLRVAKRDVEIVRGHKSRDKLLAVEGMTDEEALERLSADSR